MFGLIADLKGDLRDRQVTERWWLVWVVCGCQILPTNLATQWLIWRGDTRLWPFLAVWGTQIALLPLTIKLVQRRHGGQRSLQEAFIWRTWATFLAAASLWAVVNGLLGRPIEFTATAVPLLAAIAWAAMAAGVHAAFAGGAVLFTGATLAMALLPAWQFVIYGACWFATLIGLGLYFRPRRIGGRAL